VENSAFLPWLTLTAFLHSVIIQEKRGMFKIWNMILIVLSFCLMVLGTFVTRTGVISSVHSFARSSLGVPFWASQPPCWSVQLRSSRCVGSVEE
jgi:cytochrome c-type biogenesis protein CcmF